ncbi:MAG: magnesium-dependent phosphatase-1 [Planctomycetota bacterium]|nr:magnesium-dependent phosphatase-1 [Planctomycetota bacterium]
MGHRLFVFDLDETLWCEDLEQVGPYQGPFRLKGQHLACCETATVRLRRGARKLMRSIHQSGGICSLACRSDAKVCGELLDIFGIREHFFHPRYGLMEKGEAILEVLKELHDCLGVDIRTDEVLFVDDSVANLREARRVGATTLLYGRDIRNLGELQTLVMRNYKTA